MSKTLDVFIRWMLSAPGHESILIHVISAVRLDSGQRPIVQALIKNPFTLKSYRKEKEFILDVNVTDEIGVQYDVEIQTTREADYINRALVYWAKLHSTQLKTREHYGILRPTIGIHFCDFTLFSDLEKGHTYFHLTECRSAKELTDQLGLHFIEFPKYNFNKRLLNDLEKLLLWFTFEPKETSEVYFPEQLKNDPIYQVMEEKYREFNSDENLRAYAFSREKFIRDTYNSKLAAQREARAAGRAEGLEEGHAEGLFEGQIKGRADALIDMAKKAKLEGLPLDLIIKLTGLTEKEILEL